MQYNNEWIKTLFDQGQTLAYVFFWGHQSSGDGRIGKSCFSQWFERAFVQEGQIYPTAEHWMMASKAKLFGDEEALQGILACTSPAEAKEWGRKVNNFDTQVWNRHRMEIVVQGNLLKFGQHPDLWAFLDQTGDKILVEASPYDRIWGIGLKESAPEAQNPHQWRGENLLGYALMEVRDRLRGDNG